MLLVQDPERQKKIIEAHINALPSPIRALKIGCEKNWALHRPEKNDANTNSIYEIQSANVQSNIFSPRSLDLIYYDFSANKLCDSAWAMDNFVRWLSPYGLLVIRIIDQESVSAHLSRILPRQAIGSSLEELSIKRSRKEINPDNRYNLCMPLISRSSIWDFCEDNGFTILEEIGSNDDLNDRILETAFVKLISFLTFGILKINANLIYVLQKKGGYLSGEETKDVHKTTMKDSLVISREMEATSSL